MVIDSPLPLRLFSSKFNQATTRLKAGTATGDDVAKTILAVDDSESLRGAIRYAVCEKGGYELKEAEDGQHALGVIDLHRETTGGVFDLLLVDVNMPVMNGYELVEKVREMPDYRFTPILFVTTEGTNEAKQRGRDLNATGWINKPFSPEKLLGIVQQVLNK